MKKKLHHIEMFGERGTATPKAEPGASTRPRKNPFPKSKCKQIVYRGGTDKFRHLGNNQTVLDVIFFTSSREAAALYARNSSKKWNLPGKVYMAYLDVKNPMRVASVAQITERISFEWWLEKKGILRKDVTKDRVPSLLPHVDRVQNNLFWQRHLLGEETASSAEKYRERSEMVAERTGVEHKDLNLLSDPELEAIHSYVKSTTRDKSRGSESSNGSEMKDKMRDLRYDSIIVAKSKDNFGDLEFDQVAVLEEDSIHWVD